MHRARQARHARHARSGLTCAMSMPVRAAAKQCKGLLFTMPCHAMALSMRRATPYPPPPAPDVETSARGALASAPVFSPPSKTEGAAPQFADFTFDGGRAPSPGEFGCAQRQLGVDQKRLGGDGTSHRLPAQCIARRSAGGAAQGLNDARLALTFRCPTWLVQIFIDLVGQRETARLVRLRSARSAAKVLASSGGRCCTMCRQRQSKANVAKK
jgi:hypothetical protein